MNISVENLKRRAFTDVDQLKQSQEKTNSSICQAAKLIKLPGAVTQLNAILHLQAEPQDSS